MRFRYRAALPGGELVDGQLDAADERAAREELRRQSLVPVALNPGTGGGDGQRTFGPSRLDARAASLRSLAALVGGGAPLDDALAFSATHALHPDVARALSDIRGRVQSGQSIGQAFRQHEPVFGSLATALVEAGAASGSLDEALTRIADHADRERSLRSTLRDALLYPALLAAVSVLGIGILLVLVVPRFVGMIGDLGGTLPLSTRVLIGSSAFLGRTWWLLLVLGGVAVAGARTWLREPRNHGRWHDWRLTLPVVGPLETSTWTARFTRALGAMLQGGAPLLASLDLAASAIGNVALRARVVRGIQRVERGDRLADALHGVVPPLAAQLLAVGENSGSLDAMALRAADTFDEEVERRLRALVRLVEPVLIVLFGGLTGFVALAMLQAIYSINAGLS